MATSENLCCTCQHFFQAATYGRNEWYCAVLGWRCGGFVELAKALPRITRTVCKLYLPAEPRADGYTHPTRRCRLCGETTTDPQWELHYCGGVLEP